MEPNYRRCLACRRVAHRSEFWRVVRLHPCHTVVLDRGMGRSGYLCPQASCLQLAQRKDRLGRSLKTSVPQAVYEQLWRRLQDQTEADQGSNPSTKSRDSKMG